MNSNNFNFLDFLKDPKQTSFSHQEQGEQKSNWKPFKDESNLSKPLSSEPIIPIVNISKFDSQVESPIYFEPKKLDENEEFKLVDDTVLTNVVPNRYLVSNYGRIYDIRAEKFMNPVSNASINSARKNPYYKVKLSYVSAPNSLTLKAKDIYIHRAVMKAFDPIDNSNEMDGDHKDSNHSNNRLDNLQWVTNEENQRLAVVRGEIPRGEQVNGSKFKDWQVKEICQMLQDGKSLEYIRQIYPQADASFIYDLKRGVAYKYIGCNYNLGTINSRSSKTNESQVHQICKMIEDGYAVKDICKTLNVQRYIVNDIKFGRNYTHISCNYKFPKTESLNISEEQAHEICRKLQQGVPNADIAKDLGISIAIVQRIKRGDSFKEISSQYSFPKESRSTYVTDDVARKVCELLEKGYTPYTISKMNIGATCGVALGIKRRLSFKHISKDYNF